MSEVDDLREQLVQAEARAKKAESRERFAWTCLRAPTPDPCRNCGRIVLLGPPCCGKPDFPPYPPPVAELADLVLKAEQVADNLRKKLLVLRSMMPPCSNCGSTGWVLGILTGPDGFKERIRCSMCSGFRAELFGDSS